MKAITGQAIETLLRADSTVQVERIHEAFEVLEGRAPRREPQTEIHPEFYSVAEAGKLFRISRQTLYRLEKIGQLKSCYVEGRKLFRREALLNLLRP